MTVVLVMMMLVLVILVMMMLVTTIRCLTVLLTVGAVGFGGKIPLPLRRLPLFLFKRNVGMAGENRSSGIIDVI